MGDAQTSPTGVSMKRYFMSKYYSKGKLIKELEGYYYEPDSIIKNIKIEKRLINLNYKEYDDLFYYALNK